ncbi:MFS transporter [Pinisolibacter aquiterrae]|uniref:MFS transporter n=1 Tax=Pinisolibacter aquiterrae TaxID=2815579 RepID=UPI001C3C4DDB|nr:MFS transporter [Pinisolibacter aquiterrae]MBV5266481.1 MFS transporter [Pinisolibacter aquiterrae]MCC8234740.1 MFS transporter [Pinisolibacter aquiterrae]
MDQKTPHRSTHRRIPAGIWALGFVSLLMDVSSEMIHALLPIWLVTGLGASTLAVGLIEGIAEATASITKVFSGAISDRLGKRKLLAAIGYGMAAFTKPVFPLAGSLGWIVAARFVDRIGKGIRGAPRDALVADLSPPELRGASFGLRQTLDTIGAFLGPFLAITLMAASGGDIRLVFWVAVIPGFLSFALIVFAVRDPEPLKDAEGRPPLRFAEMATLPSTFWWVTGLATVFTLARFSDAFLILRAQSIGLSLLLVPLIMVVMNVAYALSAYPVGVLADRFDRRIILATGLVLLVGADLVLGLTGSAVGLWIGAVLWGLHMGFTQGLFATLIADTAPPALRGTAFGLFNLVTGVTLFVASLIAGALWQAIGPTATFLAGAGFAVVTLGGLWSVVPRATIDGSRL